MAETEPPVTGNVAIDVALARVAGAGEDITEQARLLGQAQEALAEALRTSREPAAGE